MANNHKIEATIVIALIVLTVSFFLNFGLNLMLAKILSASEYGDFRIAYTILGLCAPLIILGGGDGVIKLLPEYIATFQQKYVKGYLCFHIILALISFCILTALSYSFSQIIKSRHPVWFFLWLVPGFSLMYFLTKALSTLQQYKRSILPFAIIFPAVCSLCLIGWHHYHGHLSEVDAFIILGVSVVLTVSVQMCMLFSALSSETLSSKAKFDLPYWLQVGLSLLLAGILLRLILEIDLLMLELLAKNEGLVGGFSVILTIVSAYWITYQAVLTRCAPAISPLVNSNDISELKKLLKKCTKLLVWACIFITGGIISFSKPLLLMFGSQYMNLQLPLIIASIGIALSCSSSMPYVFLQYSGKQNHLFKPCIFVVILAIVLNSILIPKYQLFGVIISLCICRLLLNAYVYYIARRELFCIDT